MRLNVKQLVLLVIFTGLQALSQITRAQTWPFPTPSAEPAPNGLKFDLDAASDSLHDILATTLNTMLATDTGSIVVDWVWSNHQVDIAGAAASRDLGWLVDVFGQASFFGDDSASSSSTAQEGAFNIVSSFSGLVKELVRESILPGGRLTPLGLAYDVTEVALALVKQTAMHADTLRRSAGNEYTMTTEEFEAFRRMQENLYVLRGALGELSGGLLDLLGEGTGRSRDSSGPPSPPQTRKLLGLFGSPPSPLGSRGGGHGSDVSDVLRSVANELGAGFVMSFVLDGLPAVRDILQDAPTAAAYLRKMIMNVVIGHSNGDDGDSHGGDDNNGNLPVRLIGGPTPNVGTVEVLRNGEWGSIRDVHWDWRAAVVVCQQLGYSTGRPVFGSVYGNSTGPVWLDKVTCATGREHSLAICLDWYGAYYLERGTSARDWDAGVDCSTDPAPREGSVRLARGLTRETGQVDVFYNGVWGPLCADSIDSTDATVICRELGFRGEGRTIQAPMGADTKALTSGRYGPKWFSWTGCQGNEARYEECTYNSFVDVNNDAQAFRCQHAAVVRCTNGPLPPEGSLRLVGGANNASGTLQIVHNGQWGVIYHNSFDWKAARVACRQLGFRTGRPTAFSVYGGGADMPYWIHSASCGGNETRLADCPGLGWLSNTHTSNPAEERWNLAGLICSSDPDPPAGSVRLVGGPGPWAGRLEFWWNGAWQTSCDTRYSAQMARVACRQLGYTGGRPVGSEVFGDVSGMMDPYRPTPLAQPQVAGFCCVGNETRLDRCGIDTSTCNDYNRPDIGIWCDAKKGGKDPVDGTLRLVDGVGPWSGRVEVSFAGIWGILENVALNERDAQVICRQLNYSGGRVASIGAGYIQPRPPRDTLPFLLTALLCNGDEKNITECYGGKNWNGCGTLGTVYSYGAAVITCDPQPQGSKSTNSTAGAAAGAGSANMTLEVDSGSQDPNKLASAWWSTPLTCPEGTLVSGLSLWMDSPVSDVENGVQDAAGVVGMSVLCFQDGSIVEIKKADPFWPYYTVPQNISGSNRACPTRVTNGVVTQPYAVRARLRVVGDVGDSASRVDAMGVTNVEFGCSDGRTVTGGGLANGTWGAWSNCPNGTAVCGVAPGIRPYSGSSMIGLSDDTGMMTMAIQCCPIPRDFVTVRGARQLRLAGGSTAREGRVLVLSPDNSTWGLITDEGWDDRDAHVVCRSLGWATGRAVWSASRMYGHGVNTLPFIYHRALCRGNESAFTKCDITGSWWPGPYYDVYTYESAGVICSPDRPPAWGTVRLATDDATAGAAGLAGIAGRVEMYWDYSWGTVSGVQTCSDGRFARVICRSMGHRWGRAVPARTFSPLQNALINARQSIVAVDPVCLGTEAALKECTPNWRGFGISEDSWDHLWDVGVICTNDTLPDNGALRLVYGASSTEGRVDIFSDYSWGAIVINNPAYPAYTWDAIGPDMFPAGWDDLDAGVACRQLGFRGGRAVRGIGWGGPLQFQRIAFTSPVNCTGSEASLRDCLQPIAGFQPYWTYGMYPAGVLCDNAGQVPDGRLRLTGQTLPSMGRLEVSVGGIWGSVDADGWGWTEALVACRSLGYRGVADMEMGYGEPDRSGNMGPLPIWLSSVRCNGSETLLSQCVNGRTYGVRSVDTGAAYGQPVMSPDRVILACTNDTPPVGRSSMRLTGAPVRYMGRLEVWSNGGWGTFAIAAPPVETTGTLMAAQFGPKEAAVVCRMLGFEPLFGSTSQVLNGSGFGGPVRNLYQHFQNLACSGSERNLTSCPGYEVPKASKNFMGGQMDTSKSWTEAEDIRHLMDVGVACKSDQPPGPPRAIPSPVLQRPPPSPPPFVTPSPSSRSPTSPRPPFVTPSPGSRSPTSPPPPFVTLSPGSRSPTSPPPPFVTPSPGSRSPTSPPPPFVTPSPGSRSPTSPPPPFVTPPPGSREPTSPPPSRPLFVIPPSPPVGRPPHSSSPNPRPLGQASPSPPPSVRSPPWPQPPSPSLRSPLPLPSTLPPPPLARPPPAAALPTPLPTTRPAPPSPPATTQTPPSRPPPASRPAPASPPPTTRSPPSPAPSTARPFPVSPPPSTARIPPSPAPPTPRPPVSSPNTSTRAALATTARPDPSLLAELDAGSEQVVDELSVESASQAESARVAENGERLTSSVSVVEAASSGTGDGASGSEASSNGSASGDSKSPVPAAAIAVPVVVVVVVLLSVGAVVAILRRKSRVQPQ